MSDAERAAPDDPRLDDFRRLTDVQWRGRHEVAHGLFVAEGDKVIRRCVQAGLRMRVLVASDRWVDDLALLAARAGAEVVRASEDTLRDVTGYHVHRGALASFERPAPQEVAHLVADARRVLLLEGLVDHTNVGACFRSAAAMGVDAVVLDATCADPLYRRAVKVSMGAVLQVPWARSADVARTLHDLRDAGFHILAMTPDPSADPIDRVAQESPERVVLALGAEGDGLSAAVLAGADARVRIPMAHGIDSLNVAAATAVACYALQIRDRQGRDLPVRPHGTGAPPWV